MNFNEYYIESGGTIYTFNHTGQSVPRKTAPIW